MIRNQKDYNQIKLFIRYVIGRKSPQKLISYINDQLLFHEKMELAYTPDGITLKVKGPFGENFVPLGETSDPTCIVYLSLIGATMFASSHSTYVKRIDFVKHLRLKEEKSSLKPELEVLIPNMAPYIKRLNERLGYRAIINYKIGREAGYFFETENFRGNKMIDYHMNKRKFTCSWDKGSKVIFFTHSAGAWGIAEELNNKEIWCIPTYDEKEIKMFSASYKPKLILFDYRRNKEGVDLFGNIKPELKEQKLPILYFNLKENGSVETWDKDQKIIYEDTNKFSEQIAGMLGKTVEKKAKKEEQLLF